MSSPYLERYLHGERGIVWAELTALGPLVREEPLYSDAVAVARETMRRARHNIQLLVARLTELQYRFDLWGDPHDAHPWSPPTPQDLAALDAAEQEYGALPISVRLWYEEVGAISLIGAHPKLNRYGDPGWEAFQGAPVTDPLYVAPFAPLEDGLADLPGTDRYPFLQRVCALEIAPDIASKEGASGGPPVTLYFPNPVMDAPLVTYDWPGMLFVNYLRLSFTWGGFAGFSYQPEAAAAAREELAFLTRHLLPI